MSNNEKNKGSDPNKRKQNGRNNTKSKYKNKRKTDTKKKSNFTGKCSNLKGQVFETFAESKDATQFNKTIKALQVYVASKFRNGGDVG